MPLKIAAGISSSFLAQGLRPEENKALQELVRRLWLGDTALRMHHRAANASSAWHQLPLVQLLERD